MERRNGIIRGIGKVLLVIAYLFVMMYGFLSGMTGEVLIGSQNPVASLLSDVLMIFGGIVGLSAWIPLAAMLFFPGRTRGGWWWVIRLLPFVLLAVQLVLIAITDML